MYIFDFKYKKLLNFSNTYIMASSTVPTNLNMLYIINNIKINKL